MHLRATHSLRPILPLDSLTAQSLTGAKANSAIEEADLLPFSALHN